jgi:hypothetical protein
MTMNAPSDTLATPSPWIVSPRWDLSWLTFSALLVPLPILLHSFKIGPLGIDALVTLLIGGPHMYATFLRTVFDGGFRRRHPAAAWIPVVVIPTLVLTLGLTHFGWLLSLFFTWASLHICDQASYIAQLYREKAGGRPTLFDRGLDFTVIAGSLYLFAIHRFVNNAFSIEGYGIFFPEQLKQAWVPKAFAFAVAALVAFWVVRTLGQLKAGFVSRQYLAFMALTMGVSVLIPSYFFRNELSVTFQGFNAWHSFQYLGLTFFALNRGRAAGTVTLGFLQELASPGKFVRVYGWNVLLTLGAGVLILALTRVAGLPPQQCYYLVVLSILLVHYCQDAVLFAAEPEAKLVTGSAATAVSAG